MHYEVSSTYKGYGHLIFNFIDLGQKFDSCKSSPLAHEKYSSSNNDTEFTISFTA